MAVTDTGGSFWNSLGGASLITGGGNFLSSLAGSIFGGGGKGDIKKLISQLQGQMGQGGLSPQEQEQIVAHVYRSMAPKFNQRAEGINQRLGLDSGVAQAQLGSDLESSRQGLYGDLAMKGAEMRSSADAQRRQLIAMLTGQLA